MAIQLAKNNLSGAFRKEQEIFLRNTKLRFKHSVYPKIRQNEDESTVNDAVEEKVITPMTKMNVMFCGKKPHFADVKAALYYLTGNCHIKWSKDDV